MEISLDSVTELDVHMVGEKMFFHIFFCALGLCVQGFLERYRPYLSLNSTRLNGRWCGQMATTCGVDDHNWMYLVAFGFIDSKT
jgi:hypothetical protein